MKKTIILLLICVCGFMVVSCSNNRKNQNKFDEIQWPNSELVSLLPVPESNIGRISLETSSSFMVYIGKTSKEQYNNYVNECIEKGFIVDYTKSDNYYFADNEDGYHISIQYEDSDTMYIHISEPDKTESKETLTESEEVESTNEIQENENLDINIEDTPSESVEEDDVSSDGVRPEFKEAMDSYEAFFDEYIEFMEKYSNSDNAVEMLADYADYMSQYAETMKKMEALQSDDLSTEEAAYYAEVSARIMQKLLTVKI